MSDSEIDQTGCSIRRVESRERHHRVAFVNHAVEYILFRSAAGRQACKRSLVRSRLTARAVDKNTFVISLMVVPSIGFLSGAARRSLTYFGGVRLIALRPSYVSKIIVRGCRLSRN